MTLIGKSITQAFGSGSHSGPTPSNGSRNGFARIKIIRSKRHINNKYIKSFLSLTPNLVQAYVSNSSRYASYPSAYNYGPYYQGYGGYGGSGYWSVSFA